MPTDRRPGPAIPGRMPTRCRTMDVTAVAWRTSSYSGDNGGTCVEVGTTGPAVTVRDSKHPDDPQLAFPADTWTIFAERVKASA
jgi:hypothetical protein